MTELQDKRTYNAKKFRNEDGTYTLQAHAGHIHYKENGVFLESDFTPEDKGTYWEMTKHNYELRVAKDFAAPLLMQYRNKYEGADHTITYEPYALAWYNNLTDNVQIFRNQQSVQAVYNAEKNSFYYTGAFGAGIDFEITIRRSGFTKEVVIPNKPAVFPTPPTANHRLVALFKYGGTGLKVLKDTAEEWDGNTYFDSDGGFELAETANPIAKSFIRPAFGVDADDRRVALRVMWVKRNGQLWQIKEIPLDKLQQATFPVRFDTTTSYYTGSGDGTVFRSRRPRTWSDIHDTADGTGADTTRTTISDNQDGYGVGIRSGRSGYSEAGLVRGFLPIDTSALDDSVSISAADLKLYLDNVSDGYSSESQSYMALVQTSQASPTALAVEDFDVCGDAVDNPTKGSSNYDIGGFTNNAWTTIALNATGISWISKTGYTMLGIREGHDIEDVPITFGASDLYSVIRPRSSEYTATTYDPYLEITYTAATTFTPRVIIY